MRLPSAHAAPQPVIDRARFHAATQHHGNGIGNARTIDRDLAARLDELCTMFSHAVDAQQLLVDVQLDIQDGNNHDARLLADELVTAADGASAAITALPAWPDAKSAVGAVGGLMDLAVQAGAQYQAWFTDGKQAALRRARALRTQNGGNVPDTNTLLAALSHSGLTCPDSPLVLEAPG